MCESTYPWLHPGIYACWYPCIPIYMYMHASMDSSQEICKYISIGASMDLGCIAGAGVGGASRMTYARVRGGVGTSHITYARVREGRGQVTLPMLRLAGWGHVTLVMTNTLDTRFGSRYELQMHFYRQAVQNSNVLPTATNGQIFQRDRIMPTRSTYKH